MKVEQQLIEYEAMLHESVHRVGRAVRNMRQEMGGFSSTTPGNGSPGGGKGGRPGRSIDDPNDHHVRVPQDPAVRAEWASSRRPLPTAIEVPVTSVESQVLFGRDDAADDLDRLHRSASRLVSGLASMLRSVDRDPGPDFADRAVVGADRLLVLAYARLRRLLDPAPPADLRAGVARAELERPMSTVFALCQTWGYDTHRPVVTKDRAELLAVDLTGLWCRSHLRVGERRERSRGELCKWCRDFEALEGFMPPVDLVRIHVEFGKVRDDQRRPYRQAHRDRQRRKVRR